MLATLYLGFAGIFGGLSGKLTAFLMAIVPVGAIAFALFQIIKRQSAAVDRIKNKHVKQAVVAGLAFVLTAAFTAMGGDIACVPGENCLALVTQEKLEFAVKWAFSALTAFVLHAVKNGRK